MRLPTTVQQPYPANAVFSWETSVERAFETCPSCAWRPRGTPCSGPFVSSFCIGCQTFSSPARGSQSPREVVGNPVLRCWDRTASSLPHLQRASHLTGLEPFTRCRTRRSPNRCPMRSISLAIFLLGVGSLGRSGVSSVKVGLVGNGSLVGRSNSDPLGHHFGPRIGRYLCEPNVLIYRSLA